MLCQGQAPPGLLTQSLTNHSLDGAGIPGDGAENRLFLSSELKTMEEVYVRLRRDEATQTRI
jgi:hypothetical protein